MKKGNIFWGLIFIAAAVLVILHAMGLALDLNVWKILFTVLLAACLLKSAISKNIPGVLFSVAFLLIVYDEVLHIENLTPWPVLCAAILGSIGFSIIVGDKPRQVDTEGQYFTGAENVSGPEMNVDVNFGSVVKNVNSDDFKILNASCNFGAMKIYFQNAMIQGECAELHLHMTCSGIEVYVPKEWIVVNQADTSFGGMTEKNHPAGGATKKLILTGNISFAGVDIFYV